MDGVKLIANGIRLEKQLIKKENTSGKSTRKRAATHDSTNIGKSDDAGIIIDATKGKGKKKTDKDESSVDRTEEQDTEKESEDTEKESD